MEDSNYKWGVRKFNLYECGVITFSNPIIMKFNLYSMFMSNGGKWKSITYAII